MLIKITLTTYLLLTAILGTSIVTPSQLPAVKNEAVVVTTNWTAIQSKLIIQAGKRLGVPLQTKYMVHFAQGSASSFAAPAANLASIPATDLRRGVDIGVAYFDFPNQKFPKGFYKIHAVADVKLTGRIDGTVQLINEGRTIVRELPATFVIRFLTIPEGAESRPATVSIGVGEACNTGGDVDSGVGGDYWHCTFTFWGTACLHLGGIFEDA